MDVRRPWEVAPLPGLKMRKGAPVKRIGLQLGLWSTLLVLTSAGCPRAPFEEIPGLDNVSTTSGSGNRGSGSGNSTTTAVPGTTDVGPRAPGSGATIPALDDVNGGTGTLVGGSQVTSVPDALTARFSGCEEPPEVQFWRAEIFRLVNQARAARGFAPLQQNNLLEAQATQYACELIFYRFFAHENPVTGSALGDRSREFGYDFWIVGENLAAGQRTPVEVFEAWMASPCHRENILNPAFTELGIGIRYGGDYGYYWVQEFGRPFAEEPYRDRPFSDPECNHGA